MLSAWQAGSTRLAEEWLDRHPEVKAKPELAVRVIYEELCLREEHGESVDLEELHRRFPQFREALSLLLSCHRLMNSDAPSFPVAGEQLGEFHLLRELGRGGLGRVFLATQPSLSDRPLVVKLTPQAGDEHLSLARLQHTHIVPLFLVQDFPERNLRALCMPFLGGASWSSILQELNSCKKTDRSGARIVQALESGQRGLDVAANSKGPAIGFLTQASYEQAVCWIGSCLADALHYAHQRGLLHLDIKPSNVLIASDGQPMLLDFHLAYEVDPVRRGDFDRVGGTPGYMSPEQQQRVRALREGRSIPVALDRRSDIYSLGALLFESLAGQVPPTSGKRSRELLRSRSPLTSRGLEDILQKCLAPDRYSRYADAGELAADLRRHIANLPLRGVANRSLVERWQKWRRRRPHSLISWFVSLTALTAIGVACLFVYIDRVKTARSALKQAEQNLAEGDFASAIGRLEIGSQAIRWLPGQDELRQSFQSDFAAARRARVVGALHELVEQLRFMDDVEGIPPANVRELDAGCRAIWETRSQIAAARPSRFKRKENNNDIDLMDLALMWTRLMTRDSAKSGSWESSSNPLTILAEAEELLGPSPALTLARTQLTGHLVSADQYAALISRETPRTAWECDAIGRSLMQAGGLTQAIEIFEQAIQLEPDAFWPHFHLATCAYRSKRFDEALRAACVCVALSPKRAECFFNRGLCFRAVGQSEAALHDFGRAIELEPGLASAALQRGILLAEMQHPAEALENLNRAADLGGEPAAAYYQMALIHFGQHEWTAARKCVVRSLQRDSTYAPALSLQVQIEAQLEEQSQGEASKRESKQDAVKN